MVRTYVDLSEEELKEKILMVVDYMIETKCSTRKAAKYASENGFQISHVSFHRIIHTKLPKIDMKKYQEVIEILNKNTPKSIEDVTTKKRIYSATAYLLQDFIITEIAEMLDSTPDIIYDDLTMRLPKIDANLAKIVKRKLQEHRLENLGQYKTEVPPKVLDEQLENYYNVVSR